MPRADAVSASSPLLATPARAPEPSVLSPPGTPVAQTVQSSASSSSSSVCMLTVSQLLAHVELLAHALQQPGSPHPLLLCNDCLLPVSRHAQPPPSAQPLQAEQSGGEQQDGGPGVVDGWGGGGKLINDPIHGYIHLEPELVALVDTPHFQRLRELKQLGTCYLVFPGASHNRFEHSLGVAHLADALLTHLQGQQPELRISAKEKFLVKLAGLCHDLGHGPFSHVFDNEFLPRALRAKAKAASPSAPLQEPWHHEQASIMMLKAALEAAGLELSASELSFVSEVIDPAHYPARSSSKAFLYEIVANARTSLDVDKLDYLARDCHNIGLSTALRHERLIKNCRVIDGQLCFNSKEGPHTCCSSPQPPPLMLLRRSTHLRLVRCTPCVCVCVCAGCCDVDMTQSVSATRIPHERVECAPLSARGGGVHS